MKHTLLTTLCAAGLAPALLAGAFTVGPDYERPATELPDTYKGIESIEWKEGAPADHLPKGHWWEIFGDPTLDGLQLVALQSNQELKAAFAVVNQARATARIARSEFFPWLNFSPGFRRERFSPNQEPDFGSFTANTYAVPIDLSYEIDLWGRVRRSFESARAEAAAQTAAFHNLLLTLQADIAQNYFSLRSLDAEIALLRRTIGLRQEQVQIVSDRFDIGIGAELDVARARVELKTAEADLAALLQRRTEFENALAILTGQNPSSFQIVPLVEGADTWNPQPPTVPVGLPAELLERRPDIAEAERRLAADNARIGVAKAAFFPAIRLTGAAGYLSADAESLFNWESRAWSIGPSISLPIFAGGRNRANLNRSRAEFEESVARYRQQILVAFGEVENTLAAIRHLADQAVAQAAVLDNSRQARDLATEAFTTGLSDYLSVIDADRAALQSHRATLQLAALRLIATVQLVKALGGGWGSHDAIPIAAAGKTS